MTLNDELERIRKEAFRTCPKAGGSQSLLKEKGMSEAPESE
jgi:hypothetical protein